ncbi:hemagglutinin repeat-containing protein [Aeromonas dhakensis]
MGEQVSGNKVNSDIGHNMALISQQDNDHYQSQQSCISAGGSYHDGLWLRQCQPSEEQMWL